MYPLRSMNEFCAFPAVLDGPAASAAALQHQLAHSQWWPAEQLARQQAAQLRLVLEHALRTVPLYRRLYEGLEGVDAGAGVAELLERLPLLTRRVLQDHPTHAISTAIPESHGNTHRVSTSGSTGRPVQVLHTRLSTFFWRAFTLREHYWHQRDLSQKLAAIRYAPGAQNGRAGAVRRDGWGPSTDLLHRTGPSAFLSVLTDVSDQAQWLAEEDPAYLISHPSNLLALAEHCRAHHIRPPALRECRSVGEVVSERLRQACHDAWGVPVTDIYSTQEVGYIALQCPEHEHYHIQAEGVVVEVLDAAGRPCAPGEIGRVVVTTLHNFASPLIRYEVGDYAEAGASCPCGRALPVLKRIVGRTRNMLTLPNGKLRWPVFGYAELARIVEIQQMQIVQHSAEELEVRLQVRRTPTPKEEEAIAAVLSKTLGHRFGYRFRYQDEIPRGASGKYEEFLSLL